MKALVLLSQGLHPVSGKACLPRVEAQAVRLAAALAADAGGLHAGPSAEIVREALGRGLTHLNHLKQDADPVPALVAALGDLKPDVVFAGPSGQGGEDTGLVPYAVAHALGWPLVAHAVGAELAGGALRVTQALPKGARRFVLAPFPVLVTAHRGAPPPLPFAYARARAGRVVEIAAAPAPPAAPDDSETRPYRARPKAFAANAAPQGKGRVLVNPDPHEAAREILAFLRKVGVGGTVTR
jgi:electron transfer flavoprotein beta subunit